MRMNRGDVVLVDYPFTTGGAKVRPALVVQNDRDNARMKKRSSPKSPATPLK
jgi:mRNA-degrading endonuclease toxin of MazEF toxin-antitoxin module